MDKIMEEYVTFDIALKAKEKGFSGECRNFYYENNKVYTDYDTFDRPFYDGNPDIEDHFRNWNSKEFLNRSSAPTYHQLIDWIFNKVRKTPTATVDRLYQINTLEFWYNLLKDCPLKYEFKGRLLEWFKSNGYGIMITPIKGYVIYKPNSSGIAVKGDKGFKTYKEAEHKGIEEIFKLLKKESNGKEI